MLPETYVWALRLTLKLLPKAVLRSRARQLQAFFPCAWFLAAACPTQGLPVGGTAGTWRGCPSCCGVSRKCSLFCCVNLPYGGLFPPLQELQSSGGSGFCFHSFGLFCLVLRLEALLTARLQAPLRGCGRVWPASVGCAGTSGPVLTLA